MTTGRIESIPGFTGELKTVESKVTIEPNLYDNGRIAIELTFKRTSENGVTGVDILTKDPSIIDGLEGDDGERSTAYLRDSAYTDELVKLMTEQGLCDEPESVEVGPSDSLVALVDRLKTLGIKRIYTKSDLAPVRYTRVSFSDDVLKLAMLNRASTGM